MASRVGSRLGPYEIVAPLGAGGMGHVYRARDDRLGRDIAIKVLPEGIVPDADTLKRFEREARAVAALNHPNILAIHDIGNADGIVYIVTELLEGMTLRERLHGGALAPRRALDYAIQMAHGLGAAHERGVVHRDLKPENLFLTGDGRLKILDFGVAQIEGRTTGQRTTLAITQPGMVIGTPGYMAPEQITGEGATPRSDVFAFGLVVYEMLTGTQPFRRSTAHESMGAVLRDDPLPLTHSAPGVPSALARIIERCLEKRPADRPGSAADLGLYLEALGSDASTQPMPVAHSVEPPRRIARRILTAACALLLLVAGATWAYVQVMADGAVSAALETALARAEGVVQRVHAERLTRLSLTARLVASIPELKALFETNAATIRDFLLFHQQRNPGSPLLLALSPQGRVLARTDTVAAQGDALWMAVLQAANGEAAVVEIDGRLHHAAAAAADAGGSVFGHVVAAVPVDAEFAREISASTLDDAVLLSNTTVLASTLRAGPPWKSLSEWRKAGGSADRSLDVRIGAQQFAAREVKLADNPALSTITIKSRDEAIGPYRRIQRGLLVIGLLGIAAAVAGSLWIGAAGQR